MTASEKEIQNAIRLAFSKRLDVCLWRNSTGMFQTMDGRPTRAGLAVGSADLIGMVAPLGRLLALEVKRPGEKASEQQLKFLELVRSMGGIAAVVTSVEEATAAVESSGKWKGTRCEICNGTKNTATKGMICTHCGTDGYVWRKL